MLQMYMSTAHLAALIFETMLRDQDNSDFRRFAIKTRSEFEAEDYDITKGQMYPLMIPDFLSKDDAARLTMDKLQQAGGGKLKTSIFCH